ncbi:MAG: outer membrane lipoprotein carrier protein LolA [Candidatus Zixiibacteriota bacterium]
MLATVAGLLLTTGISADTDVFEQIKAMLGEDGCSHFEFMSIIESDVFDQVDTATGTAYLARDGRYNIEIGQDKFLCDGEYRYSYSEGSGQVIIEKMEPTSAGDEEFSFIIKLGDFYNTHVVKKNHRYRLVRKSEGGGSYPDSLYVTVDKDTKRLKRFDYLDVNEEANTILFLKQDYRLNCDDTWFQPNFPDSVERVRL